MKRNIHFLVIALCLFACLSSRIRLFAKEEKERVSSYEAKQIILMDTVLEEYEGAEKVTTYPEYGYTLLSFRTKEAVGEAYEELLKRYGSEKCYLDQVYQGSDLMMASSSLLSYEANSWGTTLMGMEYLKNKMQSAKIQRKVTVAVIDTGVNKNSILFKGRKITGYNTMLKKKVFYDIAPQFSGHGSHVCGIVADATPVNVDILVVSVFDEKGRNTGGALLNAFIYAIEQGADVINCSLGYEDCSEPFLDAIIREAYKRKIPIIAAAGNSETNVSHLYPASNAQTIAVSAVKETGSSVVFDSSYSNYGQKIDFCGPGTNIKSASRLSDTKTALMSGTSMAAPHITAAFAWLKLLYPNDSVAKLYSRMKQYSVDLGSKGKDIYYGNGLPKLRNLLSDYAKENAKKAELKQAVAKLKACRVKLQKVQAKSEKELLVKWTSKRSVHGYQICYSRSGSFSKGRKMLKVSGSGKEKYLLKRLASGKRYYVKIRAYKIINKKTYYSAWSKIKTAKCR